MFHSSTCLAKSVLVIGLLTSLALSPLNASEPLIADTDFQSSIKPILTAYCVQCHGEQKHKADLRLDTLAGHFSGADAESWHDVLNRVEIGEMPPEKAKAIPTAERRRLVAWIRSGIRNASLQQQGRQDRTVVRRLTRYEYNNTLRDLTGIDLNFARDLPPESSSSNGFKNNGRTLGLSPLQIEYYLLAARRAMDRAIVSGEAPEIYRHRFEESSPSNTPRIKTPIGNRMEPGGRFFGKMLEYPSQGEFIVRVKAAADIPPGQGVPRMHVSLGLRSDTVSPTKMLAEVDVVNSKSQSKVYEFRARIEEFPLPGHNPKFPGVTIAVENVYDDGLPPELPILIDTIRFSAAEKNEIALAAKQNAPELLQVNETGAGKKTSRNLTKLVATVQQGIEELRRLDPDHKKQLDLALRLFDVQASCDKLKGQVQNLAKQIKQDPDALWEAYQTHNSSALSDHQAVLARFDNLTPVDRKDKAAMRAFLPAPPDRSTLVLQSLEFEGPIFDRWPPASHRRLLPDVSGSERSRAASSIQQFMSRAYRRPVTDQDVQVVLSFYDELRPVSESFEEAMRESFAMILVSPEFLYLFEPNETQERRPLTQHELATRISYFLWSTMPDPALIELANEGKLSNPDILAKHVREMIRDPKTEQLVEHFTDQWLDLSGIERVAINPEYYPDFDDRLKPMMRKETHAFVTEILRNDLSVLNLLDSEFLMLNEPLAKHYGLTGPQGGQFERVQLEQGSDRGGILTQAAVLLLNSTGEDSHPIRRGVWLRSRLLDDPPAPPPPDVPDLDSEEPELASLSVRQQLEFHRTKEACNDCHRGIDPWGIPFEQFDAVGKWRDTALRIASGRKKKMNVPVEAVTILPNGQEIDGIRQLKNYLLEQESRRFSRAFTSRLLEYSIGRSVTFSDHDAVESLNDQFSRDNFRLSDLIVEIVKSDSFQSK